MSTQNKVVELFETLAAGEITVKEFIQLARQFSDEELRHLRNILRAVGARKKQMDSLP